MARPKGFKLSAEQKARMQAGRKQAKVKAKEGMITSEEVPLEKKKKEDILVVGYAMDKGDLMPYPIFESEKNQYKNRIYKTPQEAREALK
jgi:hypothetical protein